MRFFWSSLGTMDWESISKLTCSVIRELERSCDDMERNLDFIALRRESWALDSLRSAMRRRFSASRRSFSIALAMECLRRSKSTGLAMKSLTDSWMALTAVARLACAG